MYQELDNQKRQHFQDLIGFLEEYGRQKQPVIARPDPTNLPRHKLMNAGLIDLLGLVRYYSDQTTDMNLQTYHAMRNGDSTSVRKFLEESHRIMDLQEILYNEFIKPKMALVLRKDRQFYDAAFHFKQGTVKMAETKDIALAAWHPYWIN